MADLWPMVCLPLCESQCLLKSQSPALLQSTELDFLGVDLKNLYVGSFFLSLDGKI